MTVTSQIVVTLAMALFSFSLINIIYIISKRLSGVELFLPAGAPLFIAPFLIQIELISYFSRVISLSVRLFANLTSGHTLIKILSGFALSMLVAGGLGSIAFGMPLFIIFMVTGLELMIAGLQTYVFVVLFSIYAHELEAGH